MRVIIAEDDRAQAQRLGALLTENAFEVLYSSDGFETLALLRKSLPDALVLDMVMPLLDGAAVLDALPSLSLEKKPLIAVLMPAHAKQFKAQAQRASMLFEKPCDPKKIVQLLQNPPLNTPSPTMREIVEGLLIPLGVRTYTKGFLYLTEAIGLVAMDFSKLDRIGDFLYAPIAAKHGVRTTNVERLIRHAIESATVRGRLDAYHKLFGYTLRRETGKPTNAEFIATLAENARRAEGEVLGKR